MIKHLLQRAVHVADATHVLEADEPRLALVLGNLRRLLPERRCPYSLNLPAASGDRA